MTMKELKFFGFPCVECVNHQIGSLGGGFGIDLNCKLSIVPLSFLPNEKIKNCKNFITEIQYNRQLKIKKILKNGCIKSL